MEQLRCRTCFEIMDPKECIEISELCSLEKTIKEVIIMLVPDMMSTLFDNECICRTCLSTLQSSLQFIERCLEVEMIIADEKVEFENYEEIDEVDGNIDLSTKVEDDKVEYSEIIIDDQNDQLNCIDLEHDYYIKDEPEDYETLNSENNLMPAENVPESMLLSNIEVSNEPAESPPVYMFSDLLTLYKDICDDKDALETHDIVLESNTHSEDPLSKTKHTLSENKTEDLLSESKTEFEILYCQTCSEQFISEEDYELHLDLHPSFICAQCGKDFKLEKSYRYHMRLHKTQDTLCETCGKTFKGSSALNVHITSVHSTERQFMCDKCPKKYKNKFKLGIHMRMVHERVLQQQCQECGRVFQSRESCLNHYRLVHLKLKPYVCEICGKGFGRNDYLRKHVALHNGEPWDMKPSKRLSRIPKYGIRLRDPGTPVPCKVCGKMIRSVHLLKVHLQTHVKMKRQKCKYCSLTFKMSNNRDRHQKLHEVDPENKFRCNICWKRMKTEEELNQHVLGHDNRPPQHSCDICGEKFHRRYLLDNHHLDKHTGPGDIERAEHEIVVQNLLEFADPAYLSTGIEF